MSAYCKAHLLYLINIDRPLVYICAHIHTHTQACTKHTYTHTFEFTGMFRDSPTYLATVSSSSHVHQPYINMYTDNQKTNLL